MCRSHSAWTSFKGGCLCVAVHSGCLCEEGSAGAWYLTILSQPPVPSLSTDCLCLWPAPPATPTGPKCYWCWRTGMVVSWLVCQFFCLSRVCSQYSTHSDPSTTRSFKRILCLTVVSQLRMKSKPPHDPKSPGPLPPLWPQLPPSSLLPTVQASLVSLLLLREAKHSPLRILGLSSACMYVW